MYTTHVLGLNTYHKASQPLFTIVRLLLVKCHVYERTIFLARSSKLQHMLLEIRKVRFGICRGAGPQTLSTRSIAHAYQRLATLHRSCEKPTYFVILDGPPAAVVVLFLPGFVLGNCEEGQALLALCGPNDRSNELDKETRDLQKSWEEVVEPVDDETLNVRAIMILRSNLFSIRRLTHNTVLRMRSLT